MIVAIPAQQRLTMDGVQSCLTVSGVLALTEMACTRLELTTMELERNRPSQLARQSCLGF